MKAKFGYALTSSSLHIYGILFKLVVLHTESLRMFQSMGNFCLPVIFHLLACRRMVSNHTRTDYTKGTGLLLSMWCSWYIHLLCHRSGRRQSGEWRFGTISLAFWIPQEASRANDVWQMTVSLRSNICDQYMCLCTEHPLISWFKRLLQVDHPIYTSLVKQPWL